MYDLDFVIKKKKIINILYKINLSYLESKTFFIFIKQKGISFEIMYNNIFNIIIYDI